MASVDLGVISPSEQVITRCREICNEFGFSIQNWSSPSELVDNPVECRLIIADASLNEDKTMAAEMAQAAKYACSQAYLVCILSKKVDKEAAAFIKTCGANAVFIEDEVFSSSKLEFAATQTIQAEYLTLKASDLTPGKELYFDLFHFLPLRGKFLKCASQGDVLTREKLDKMLEVGEVYIRRSSSDDFARYAKDNPDLSAKGLTRRCRAQYLALYSAYMDLAFLLTDQSEHSSYGKGAELLERLKTTCAELLTTIGSLGDAWSVINNSTLGEAGSCERAPAVVAYVALYGILIDLENTEEAMLGALLADLGLLLLPPDVTRIIRSGDLSQMNPEQEAAYKSYPLKSLDMVLSCKLPLEPELREIITTVQERFDGKGFPKGISKDRLKIPAQLIQFSKIFDSKTVVRKGKLRPDIAAVKKQMSGMEVLTSGMISPVLVEKLKAILTS